MDREDELGDRGGDGDGGSGAAAISGTLAVVAWRHRSERPTRLVASGLALLVVDERGVIVDPFGVAPTVLEPSPTVGDPIASVFPDAELDEPDGTNRSATVDGRLWTYQFQVSPLEDHHARQTGMMRMIRDVTGLHGSERRLRVGDRALPRPPPVRATHDVALLRDERVEVVVGLAADEDSPQRPSWGFAEGVDDPRHNRLDLVRPT